MNSLKRFAVGVKIGFHFHGNEVGYDYKNYYFDTYSAARRFAMRFPKGDTYLIDRERLPF